MRLPSTDIILAHQAKRSLPHFVKLAWSLIEPAHPLKWNWHHDAICDILTLAINGDIKRFVINVPPGTTKSLMIVMLTAWRWTTEPGFRHVTLSYALDNTRRDNRRVREIVASDWYKTHYDCRFASDRVRVERLRTTQGGYRIASSVGGILTGEHPHFITIDDPLKGEQARSETYLQGCIEWLRNSVFSRAAMDPAIGIIMQRLAERDPSGYVLEKGGWTSLCLPMRYASRRLDNNDKRPIPDPRDKRKVDGELLFPELYNETKVQQLENELLEEASGQLEQLPVPPGGSLVKRSDFKILTSMPTDIQWTYRFWDTAGTENAGCLTSGTKAGFSADDNMYITHWIADRIDVEKVDVLIHTTAILDGKQVFVREERQGAASGKALTRAHKRLLKGFNYEEVIVTGTGDKLARSRSFRSRLRLGKVYIVIGNWDHEALLDHLCMFPVGKYSDPMDSTSGCWNAYVEDRDNDKLYKTQLTFGRGRRRRMGKTRKP